MAWCFFLLSQRHNFCSPLLGVVAMVLRMGAATVAEPRVGILLYMQRPSVQCKGCTKPMLLLLQHPPPRKVLYGVYSILRNNSSAHACVCVRVLLDLFSLSLFLSFFNISFVLPTIPSQVLAWHQWEPLTVCVYEVAATKRTTLFLYAKKRGKKQVSLSAL